MKLRKKAIILLFTFIVGVISLVGCGDEKSNTKDSSTIKVGAAQTPHSEILNHVKSKLKDKGINLEVVVLDSEDELNPALDEKQIDANYFQHEPYLKSVSKEKGYDFEIAGKIHVEPMGLYSNSIKSLKDLKKGDKIGIPNNPSNEYRALKLLEVNGLIKLKDGLKDYSATPDDIVENKLNLEFIETDAPQLPRSLDDLAAAVINTNLVIDAGIDTDSAIVREDSDSDYANIVVVRKGDSDRKEIKELIKALQSDDVKKFIKEEYGSAVVPAF